MGAISYRANLSSAIYPMTIADGGRTVIMPGPDQNFDRRVDPQGEQKDAGIPQALYMENVMPTVNGYQSVGFWDPDTAMTNPGGGAHIVQVIDLRATETFVGPSFYTFVVRNTPLFCWSDGSFTCGPEGANTVTFSGTAITGGSSGVYSIAVVAGTCYLYFGSTSVKELYTVTISVGGNITLTNITASVTPANFFSTNDIISFCGTNNYLVAHNNTTIFHSSTTTPTDFVASLVSGAGEIQPNNSDDALVYIKENLTGFYLYAANNILQAQYTGNSRYPFKFVPVTNSTGLYSGRRWEFFGQVDTGGHYVIEKNKVIKLIQQAEATPIAPEVSDFLAKNPAQAVFDYTTNTFSTQTIETSVPSIYVHMNRYILLSVNGTNEAGTSGEKYTHVIVFDMHLRRYGRLKLDHTFMFCYWVPNEIIGFVNKQNNTIKYLSFDIYGDQTAPYAGMTTAAHQGVLVLGKFQYARSRMIQMHEIELEGIQDSAIVDPPNISCVLLPSLNGKSFNTPVTLTASSTDDGLAVYPAHATAKNHSLAIKGAFSLSTVQLKFSVRGDA